VSAGHLIWHGQRVALVEKCPQEDVERGLFLAGLGYFNYYHWMIELLPKLYFLRALEPAIQDYPILLGEEFMRFPQFREALDYWLPNAQTKILKDAHSYRVHDLYHINAPANLPFNLRAGDRLRISDFLISGEDIRHWRQLALPTSSHHSHKMSRIFLLRDLDRRSYNQEEAQKAFEARGFVGVYPERLSLHEQVDLFSSASFIVGPSGAAWTNLIFCRSGTRALCWMAGLTPNFAAYSNLASKCGVTLRYVIHKTVARTTGELYSAPYSIDPDVLIRTFEEMESDTF
jgi:capsular polysaccharide biosynthesis protein